VSTAIPDVRSLFPDVVRIAADAEGFTAACREILGQTAQQRQALAAEMQSCVWRYSWDDTARAVHEAIDAVLQQAPRFPAAPASTASRTFPTVAPLRRPLAQGREIPAEAPRPAAAIDQPRPANTSRPVKLSSLSKKVASGRGG
ncbi:MAG: hypothetical protein ACJ8G7_01205, partial [Rhizobacter sp.]